MGAVILTLANRDGGEGSSLPAGWVLICSIVVFAVACVRAGLISQQRSQYISVHVHRLAVVFLHNLRSGTVAAPRSLALVVVEWLAGRWIFVVRAPQRIDYHVSLARERSPRIGVGIIRLLCPSGGRKKAGIAISKKSRWWLEWARWTGVEGMRYAFRCHLLRFMLHERTDGRYLVSNRCREFVHRV